MSSILNALFSVGSTTALSSYASDDGATFSLYAGSGTPNVYASFGGVCAPGNAAGGARIWRSSAASSGAGMTVSSSMYYDSASFTHCCVAACLGASGGYVGGYSTTAGKWFIARTNSGGTLTDLALSAAASLSGGSSYTVDLIVTKSGSDKIVELKVGGVTVAGPYTDAATPVADGGYPGMYFSPTTNDSGMFLGALTADDNASGVAGVTMSASASLIAGSASAAASGAAVGATVTAAASLLTGPASAPSASAPFPPTVADRVRDVATAASGSSVTLAATPPSGYRTFASAFSVGAQQIPVCVEDTAGAWMVAMCTLSATATLTVASIVSSSNGGAAPASFSGTIHATCVMPARLAFKARHVDLSEYEIYPDFSGDSTAGIQQAVLDAYSRRVEKIICPPGHFRLAGPLVGSGNCQIYVPNTRESSPNRSIYIEGASSPNFQQQGLRDVVPPDNGTVFESTITGTSGSAVFGAEQGNSGDAWVWNYTNFGMSNCGVRTKLSGGGNPISALNLRYLSQVPLLDMLRIDVDCGLLTAPTPNSGSHGIILPPVNNHVALNIGLVYVSGYHTGVLLGEHTQADKIVVVGAVRGIELQDGPHGSWIGIYSVEHAQYGVYVNGQHPLGIGHYDAEHNTAFSWGTFAADLQFAAGARKIAILRSTVVQSGVGYNEAAFVSSDATKYKVVVGAGAN